MEVISSRKDVVELCARARHDGLSIGFVPTMGALHEGHARLMRTARQECGFVVLSIFVNPLQFGAGEDLSAYPRSMELDSSLAESLGCDLLFAPDEEEMYGRGRPEVTVDPGSLGERLEGASRPGHFRGVLTVVAKLLNMVGPCHAYFGEKDAQQLALVRRMVGSLDIPAEIVPVATAREADGLAISSRNAYLSPDERLAAPVLFDAVSLAAELARGGQRDADVIRAEMARTIGGEPLARLDYVAVVDEDTWEDVRTIQGPARALVSARIGSARLIDNLLLPGRPAGAVHNSRDV